MFDSDVRPARTKWRGPIRKLLDATNSSSEAQAVTAIIVLVIGAITCFVLWILLTDWNPWIGLSVLVVTIYRAYRFATRESD